MYYNVDTSVERYNHIRECLKLAREMNNKRQIKLWTNKLTQWQQAYGAYAPIKRVN